MDQFHDKKKADNSEPKTYNEEGQKDRSLFELLSGDFGPIKTVKCPHEPDSIRKVMGCGKKSGLQLIIDSQKMMTLLPQNVRSKGYYIFVLVGF